MDNITGIRWENPYRWAENGSDNISTPGTCASMKDYGIQDRQHNSSTQFWIKNNEVFHFSEWTLVWTKIFCQISIWEYAEGTRFNQAAILKNTTRRTNCQIAKITKTRRYSKKTNSTKNLLLKYMPWKPMCVQSFLLIPSSAQDPDTGNKMCHLTCCTKQGLAASCTPVVQMFSALKHEVVCVSYWVTLKIKLFLVHFLCTNEF